MLPMSLLVGLIRPKMEKLLQYRFKYRNIEDKYVIYFINMMTTEIGLFNRP